MSQAWVLPLILLIGWVIWTTRSRSAV